MTRTTILALLVLCALAWCGVRTAHADGGAAAESLYDEGNRLYGAGEFARACPKYEASLQINPASIDARGRLALCYEKIGRLASAWSAWRELKSRARRIAGRSRAVTIAARHIAALEPKLGYVTATLSGGGAPPVGLVITIDGTRMPAESLGSNVAIDQGKHQVKATAPGFKLWSTAVTTVDGKRHRLVIGPLVAKPKAAKNVAGGAFEQRQPPPSRPPRLRKWLGVTTAGVGVLALGLGAWAGLDSKAKRDQARGLGCTDDLGSCPAGAALDAANAAYARANLSTGSWIAGAALVAGGVVLWITAPRSARTSKTTSFRVVPSVGPGRAHVGVSVAW